MLLLLVIMDLLILVFHRRDFFSFLFFLGGIFIYLKREIYE